MYNKILGIQKLQYNPGFTSTHTEHVFKLKGRYIMSIEEKVISIVSEVLGIESEK